MNVLLVGSGGREHAIAWKLSQSKKLDKLFIAPGNPGTALHGKNVDIGVDDIKGLVDFAKDNDVELAIIGPEDPLAATNRRISIVLLRENQAQQPPAAPAAVQVPAATEY